MVVDLTAVPYMDSGGSGMLVHTQGLMRQREGKLRRLCGVTERVASVLKMTVMDTVLPVDADATANLVALGSAS